MQYFTQTKQNYVLGCIITAVVMWALSAAGVIGVPQAIAETATSSTSTASTSPDVTNNFHVNAATTTATTTTAAAEDQAATSSATRSSEVETEVKTGDANAVASVANVSNSTFVNSSGLIRFLSTLFGAVEEIDLRDMLSRLEAPQSAGELSVTGSSTATTTNQLRVRANTGSNKADVGGDARLTTGNARAAANVVNVVNTTVTDSKYLLLTFNSFGDWGGDLILPGAEQFNELFSGSASTGDLVVDNENAATTTTDIALTAGTGSNVARGATSSVETGEVSAAANIINSVNQTYTNAPLFGVAIRVHGDWSGNVFGAPDSVKWSQTKNGLQLFLAPGAGGVTTTDGDGPDWDISTHNRAQTENGIQVTALTGDNQLVASGTAAIETGNARVAANVINIVNTTVYGQNMLLGILNIFGDWDGDISFGQPDLWVGAIADFDNPRLPPGSEITLQYQVKNNGDADATEVELTSSFDSSYITFIDDEGEPVEGSLTLSLGTISAGEAKMVEARARVSNDLASGREEVVKNTISVDAREPEEDDEDNTEVLTLTINDQVNVSPVNVLTPVRDDEPRTDAAAPVDFTLKMSQDPAESLTVPGQVTYTITLQNNEAEAVENVRLAGTLTNAAGQVIQREPFTLGTVRAGEKIRVSYTTAFSAETPGGLYTNTAIITQGMDEGARRKLDRASTSLTIKNLMLQTQDKEREKGRVHGASTCQPLLGSYIQAGQANSPVAVRKLQRFLQNHGYGYVTTSGTYDYVTELAVRHFQMKHYADILLPWGLERSTGNVYYTTRQKINEMQCEDSELFSFTSTQRREMSSFRRAHLINL